jgi:glycosyltransferase involved in cell wall biosynthesis
MGGVGENRRMKTPLVSVILPVYNGSSFLKESIESLLEQSYCNFEIIIINDGSTDDSEKIIRFYSDHRIRYFYQKNIGLAKTLNRGILLSRGKYIARQDQDDFSEINRLEKQVNFLLKNPKVQMVGSNAKIWIDNKKTNSSTRLPLTSEQLKIATLFDNYFIHSAVLIRKTAFKKIGFYSEDNERQPPEDYELWSRIIRKFDVANIKENLVNYRKSHGSMSQNAGHHYKKRIIKLSIENIIHITGNSINILDVEDLANLFHKNYVFFHKRNINFQRINKIFEKLINLSMFKYSLDDKDINLIRKALIKKLLLCYFDFKCNGFLSLIRKRFF